jgi:hypothetical protein
MPSSSSTVTSTTPAPRSNGSRVWRWSAVLAAVLILHGIIGAWFAHHREKAPPPEKPPVEIVLLQPQRIAQAPARPAPKRARTAPKTPRPRAAAPAEHVLQTVAPHAPPAPPSSTNIEPPPVPASAAEASDTVAGPASGSGSGSAPAGGNASASPPKTAGQPSQGIKFSAPPSGDLRYDTFFNGMRNAPSTIRWTSDGNSYAMFVSVPLPFVGPFTYESEGSIDAFGLAPERYIEARGRRRGTDVTTFDRQSRRIAFTRTPATLALPDGAQDRFSVVMQLASLVRGDPAAYVPGVTRNFYVADNDSGEVWPMETVGDESVSTHAGFVEARHFTRLPRHAGDTRRLDVWLAPSLGWLPARILQTEPNGTQIELVWSGALAPSGAENAQASQAENAQPESAQPARTASSDRATAPQPAHAQQ